MSASTDRTATDTIKGYFYQFNLTILQILESSNDHDIITVEGIEDIDINTATDETAIQCKYHSKTEYNHSVIAKPIRLMLNHYRDVIDGKKTKVKYKYYGHFKSGQSKLTLPITLDFLKSNFLTYTKSKIEIKHYEDLKLSDNQLEDFLKIIDIDIHAISFDELLATIYKAFKEKGKLNCDLFEAEHYYYNNAIKIISDLAIHDDINKRKIDKSTFLKLVDLKQILFHKWYAKFKGKKKLLAEIKSEFFSNYNNSPFERFFLIDIDQLSSTKEEIKSLIQLISKKYSELSRRSPETHCPYVFLNSINPTQLLELKNELYSENFKFKDGFDFHGASFNVNSIIEQATFTNQIKLKLINDLNNIDPILQKITKTKEIYQFYFENPFFQNSISAVKQINIQIENFNDIKHII